MVRLHMAHVDPHSALLRNASYCSSRHALRMSRGRRLVIIATLVTDTNHQPHHLPPPVVGGMQASSPGPCKGRPCSPCTTDVAVALGSLGSACITSMPPTQPCPVAKQCCCCYCFTWHVLAERRLSLQVGRGLRLYCKKPKERHGYSGLRHSLRQPRGPQIEQSVGPSKRILGSTRPSVIVAG